MLHVPPGRKFEPFWDSCHLGSCSEFSREFFWSPKIHGILTKSMGAFFVVVKDCFPFCLLQGEAVGKDMQCCFLKEEKRNEMDQK